MFMELSQPGKGKDRGRTFHLEPRGFKQSQGRASFVTDSIWRGFISKNWMLKSVFGVVGLIAQEYAHCHSRKLISLPGKGKGNNYSL